MEVFPVAMTSIDWPSLIKMTNDKMGRSITRPLDAAGIKHNTPAGYISALGVFDNSKANASSVIKDVGGGLGAHFSITFLIFMEQESMLRFLTLARNMYLCINEEQNGVIATGAVNLWVSACKSGCYRLESVEIRGIFNRILYFMEQAGLRDLWSGWIREKLNDGTFMLANK